MAAYLKLFVDSLERYQKLSDGEFGRLVRAALQYKADGTEPDNLGRESLLWDGMKIDIDRDNEAYQNLAKIRSDAGKLGGRPKKADVNTEKQKKQKVFSESKKSQDKDKDKEEDKDNDDYRRLRACAREGDDCLSDEEKEILDYCHDLIGTFTPAQDRKVLAAAAGMSADSAIDAICIAYERGARTPDYVIATLVSQQENPGRKPGK